MVFRGEHQPFHARLFHGARDLFGIERAGIEHGFRFVAIPPLSARECVHGEMHERVETVRLPGQLARAWGGSVGYGRFGGTRGMYDASDSQHNRRQRKKGAAGFHKQ